MEYERTARTRGESFKESFPNLLNMWNCQKNGNLDPNNVSSKTNLKVWWKCDRGHEWESRVADVSNGCRCPFCAGQRVCPDNSLVVKYPFVASQWHPTKNDEIDITSVYYKARLKVWWRCHLGHEWEAVVRTRTVHACGCPYCMSVYSMSKLEMMILSEFKTIYSDVRSRWKINGKEVDVFLPNEHIAIEVDGERWHRGRVDSDLQKDKIVGKDVTLVHLREKPLDPIGAHNVFFSKKEKHFVVVQRLVKFLLSIGVKSPQSEEYLLRKHMADEQGYQELISKRLPFDQSNTLEVKYPSVSAEWHPTKNGLLIPTRISAKSGESVWWVCRNGHEWKAKISNRTSSLSGCPKCCKRPTNHIRWHKNRGIIIPTCEFCIAESITAHASLMTKKSA